MDVDVSPEGLGRVERLIGRYVDSGRYPGVVSLIARRDQVVHFQAVGRRDAERDRPMELDTIFRIYSMTKPVVSVALMMLYEEGLFQLDDPVAAYLPELTDLQVAAGGDAVRAPKRPMTVRDLLMHTSGLGSSYPSPPAGTLAELPRLLAGLPLEADPGARWIYGISTDLVGLLCEVFSGLPLDQYLRERIFEPLGMVDTGFSVPAGSVDRFAAGYTRADGGYLLADDPLTSGYTRQPSFLSGIAGLVSTAGDYFRFARMLANGGTLDGVRILGPRTVRFMTANHLPGGQDLSAMADTGGETSRKGQGFGLGFGVLLDPTVAQTIGTPGEYFWGGAASTTFFVSPADELIVIFLTQLRPSLSYPIRRELRAAVYSALTD
ncbi:serine hydrolase domain-containing protein [Kribbella sp. NPDC051718]|uniref:serine hydrolase domain-containing protein n=1 Tax=Kribbella sp. NPDC051718 TaxID=3155168 RepID=UPI00342F153A